ncbi:MAG: 4Fe-4S dicluster domain-containing protein [Gammaproteobacteria bacterium]
MSAPASATLVAGVLERFGDELYHCASCNYCVDPVWPERGIVRVCATLEHHAPSPAYSGRGFIEIARALAEGMELDLDTVAARVNTCTDCGNCEVTCPIGLHPAAIGRGLRTALAEAGLAPAALREAVAAITAQGGVRAAPALRPVAADGPRLQLYVGCHADEDAAALLPWLAAAGVDVGLVRAGDTCCGAALAELGAADTAAAWREGAGDDLVVLGYECLRHLGEATAARGFLDWLVTALEAGELTLTRRTDVAAAPPHLLESCQLKPRPGHPAPVEEVRARQLLERLGIPLEDAGFPNRHRLCCGAGGGMPRMEPAAAARMARGRLAEAGTDTSVTLDPRCARHLRAAGGAVTTFVTWLVGHCELGAVSGDAA